MSRSVKQDYDAYRAREQKPAQGGIWTMTDAEFNRELAKAWNDGHEQGFWNGRESAGDHEMRHVGLAHAQVNNPYEEDE